MSNDFAERRQFRELEIVSENPFLQEMERRCDPHAPCPSPESCSADQICIYRCQWFPDNAGSRQLLANQVSNFDRHTVDITDPAPKCVEDELLAFEKGWRRVQYGLMLLLGFVLGLGFGYFVLPQWVHHV